MTDFSNYPRWPDFPCPPAQVEQETPLEFDARLWAAYWHREQVRKYTGEPYIYHPADVASIVRTVPHTDEMIAAAWLHDVVEDCGINRGLVDKIFGGVVSTYVCRLTDISQPGDGNRAERKRIDRAHSAAGCAETQTIKLADLISNSKSILVYDANFARVYLKEKRALLEVLTEGDRTLWDRADKICREAGF